MALATSNEPAPPRDSVWTKYSPNHEFPIAGATSLVLHGLLVAGVLVGGLFLNARWHGETSQPPKLDVGFVENAKGDGGAPGGGGPSGAAPNQTEQVDQKEPPKTLADATLPPSLTPILPKQTITPLDVPTIGETSKIPDLNSAFTRVEKSFTPEASVRKPGTSNGGGQGGSGNGPGVGPGTGPGTGGSPSGSATRAEILAKRWNFLLGGDPREHLQKLRAAGITLGFVDGNNMFWVIRDLKKRPIAFELETREKYKDNIQWVNQHPQSIIGLTRELGLTGPPRQFIMLLPGDREQAIANAEHAYAQARNRDLSKVDETWFDFRIVGGAFEPVVVGQVPFEPRPKW